MVVEAHLRRPSVDSVHSTSTSLGRSRTWSDDIQKPWNLPALSTETHDERIARYAEYFRITDDQLRYIYRELLGQLAHRKVDASAAADEKPDGLCLLDSFVTQLPTGEEIGTGYAVDFCGSAIHAARVKFEGGGVTKLTSHSEFVHNFPSPLKKGLLDGQCGALTLMDAIGDTVKTLLGKCSVEVKDRSKIPVGFSVAFPCDQSSIIDSTLVEWTKEYETGRQTNDPMEGKDMATLLDMTFWRQKIKARTSVVVNDTTALLVAGAYERKIEMPPCVVSFIIGNGVNGGYVEPKARMYGYKGKIIDTQLGGFDKSLPVTDIDLEVDFADDGGRGKQIFEKLIGVTYLGECCRRLVGKVWQNEAPELAWARQSFPTYAAAACVRDSTPTLDTIDVLVMGLWEWETDFETRISIQKLCCLVFERSAGLAAAAITALAAKSGRLTPAMGGVSIAVEPFIKNFPWFEEIISRRITNLIGDLAQYIHLVPVSMGPSKGAALLTVMNGN